MTTYRTGKGYEGRNKPSRETYAARKVGAVLVGGAVVAGALSGIEGIDHAWHHHEHAESNGKAFEHVKGISSTSFILKSGANFRFSPAIIEPNDVGDPGDKAGRVQSGHSIVLIRPMEYKAGGDTWLGYTTKTTESLQDRKVHTVWVDENQLEAQGYLKRLAQPTDSTEAAGTPSIPITINGDGSILDKATGHVDHYAATSLELSINTLQQLQEAGLK